MKQIVRQVMPSGAVLGVFAVVAAALLAGAHALTADTIRASERRALLRQLQAVLPASGYDNEVTTDTRELSVPALHGVTPLTVYRARRDGQPVAAALTVTAPDGYSGPVELLVGVGVDGRLTGVRVISQHETPGLGDKVDSSRSDWILAFSGRSLDDPDARGWAVRKDGGIFDQFAGATITPRAVVKAIHRALQYAVAHREALYANDQESPDQESS